MIHLRPHSGNNLRMFVQAAGKYMTHTTSCVSYPPHPTPKGGGRRRTESTENRQVWNEPKGYCPSHSIEKSQHSLDTDSGNSFSSLSFAKFCNMKDTHQNQTKMLDCNAVGVRKIYRIQNSDVYVYSLSGL